MYTCDVKVGSLDLLLLWRRAFSLAVCTAECVLIHVTVKYLIWSIRFLVQGMKLSYLTCLLKLETVLPIAILSLIKFQKYCIESWSKAVFYGKLCRLSPNSKTRQKGIPVGIYIAFFKWNVLGCDSEVSTHVTSCLSWLVCRYEFWIGRRKLHQQ